jgi:hypothetical protein
MNNFYHKIAVTSVYTILGFALGASPQAKAATFTLAPTITFQVADREVNYTSGVNVFKYDGLGDVIFSEIDYMAVAKGTFSDSAQATEFNIGSSSLGTNKVISNAILQVEIYSLDLTSLDIHIPTNPGTLGIFGYVGNGTAETSDFEAGVFLNSVVDVSSSSVGDILNFNVTPFVNQRISNGDAFAGFGIRALNYGGLFLNNSNPFTPSRIKPRLIVETADVTEPVPEPTTIFGSALALGVGGWLKRKKSSQQNKTTSQP